MAHPYKHMAKGGQACAAARYADGGAVDDDLPAMAPDSSNYPRWGQTRPTTGARDMMEDRSNAKIGDFMKSIRQGREAGKMDIKSIEAGKMK
jgi:hypothetical protein